MNATHLRPTCSERPFYRKTSGHPCFGRAYTVDLYAVDIQLAELRIPAIEVIALNGDDDPLIGRDVLNHLIITLDGIGSMTEIS